MTREEEILLKMAKKALSAEYSKPLQTTLNGDLVSRADAIELLTKIVFDEPPYLDSETLCRMYAEEQINTLPSAKAEWIPFKKRPLTDEEKQEYPDWTYIFDCPLPDDEEEILLSNGKYVWTDTFINDGECYLDGGDDIDEGMAWMPLPKPYKGGDDE